MRHAYGQSVDLLLELFKFPTETAAIIEHSSELLDHSPTDAHVEQGADGGFEVIDQLLSLKAVFVVKFRLFGDACLSGVRRTLRTSYWSSMWN
jgi:hypothetical protein